MTSYHYTITVTALAAIGFLVQMIPLIIRQEVDVRGRKIKLKWYKRVSRIGWATLFVTAGMLIFGMAGVIASQSEKIQSDFRDSLRQRTSQKTNDSLSRSLANAHNQLQGIDSILRMVYHLTLHRDSAGRPIVINYTKSDKATIICPIDVLLAKHPKRSLQTLCNGDKIQREYGLKVHNGTSVFTIPYMAGKDFAGGIQGNGFTVSPVKYDKATGSFDVSSTLPEGVGDSLLITITANVPAHKIPVPPDVLK